MDLPTMKRAIWARYLRDLHEQSMDDLAEIVGIGEAPTGREWARLQRAAREVAADLARRSKR